MLEKQQIKRLMDIAFTGCQNGSASHARRVIKGLDQMLENSVELEICRAMSFYTVDQFEEAGKVLKAAHDNFPDDQMVVTHMALVDILTENMPEAAEKLNKVISDGKDQEAVSLAEKLKAEYC